MPKTKGDIPAPICLVCREHPAIRAHLLPKSFVREIYYEPKADEKHLIIHPETGRKYQSNTGLIERGILCAHCDNILGRFEDFAFQMLKRLRAVRIGWKIGKHSYINQGTYPFSVAVVDELVRFACGVLWKYSSVPPDKPSHIDIGECRLLFESICFHGAAIPEGVDVFIERDLLSFAAFPDPTQVYYYCAPSVGRRGNQTSHDLSWFSVGGFTIYVKLNQPGISDFAPKECWMRGRQTCFFNVDTRSIEVNSSVLNSIRRTRDDLAKLNKGIQAK